MDDYSQQPKSNFETMIIFNHLILKSFLKEPQDESENISVFICGKMNEHSTLAKYSFKACVFHIYVPHIQKLYYTEMNSDDCFTNTLKWNVNFFKKIRLCLNSSDALKNTYFTINYERLKSDISQSDPDLLDDIDKDKDKDKDNDVIMSCDRKLYFELHFIVENQDVAAFRLLLNEIVDDKPHMTILSKAIEYDKMESEKLLVKQEKFYEKEKEIEKMQGEITNMEENFRERKKGYLWKFYLLNREKNLKISELEKEIAKKNSCKNEM